MKASPHIKAALLCAIVAVTDNAIAAQILLYDATVGSEPDAQGWVKSPGSFGPDSTSSVSGGELFIDTTTTRGDYFGFASETTDPVGFPFFLPDGALEHPAMPVLDRQDGFKITFDLRVISESHALAGGGGGDDNGDGKPDRAGFSFIAISQDLFGLEIGFFDDRVFAYASSGDGPGLAFTQAESALYDTGVATRYALDVLAGNYSLKANGISLLSGVLRDYSADASTPNPYNNPSFLFFGDDTSRADSNVAISRITATVNEPGMILLLLGGLLLSLRGVPTRLATH